MRKEKTVTIAAEGRDKGKVFHLTELPTWQGEAWGTRALMALGAKGIELPDNWATMGLAGIAVVGVKALAGLDYEVARPLLVEMLECVQAVPDPNKPHVRRKLIEDDTEEIATMFLLRKEILTLHIDFFTSASLRNAVAQELAETPEN